jgi:hypothetical protein
MNRNLQADRLPRDIVPRVTTIGGAVRDASQPIRMTLRDFENGGF